MKKTALFMLPALCFMAYAFPVSAQGPQRQGSGEWENREENREEMTPAAAAKIRTDEMSKLVKLDEKQYKKIYKLYLKEEETISKEMWSNQGGNAGSPMGGGGFGGPMGGGPGGGGFGGPMGGGPGGGFGGPMGGGPGGGFGGPMGGGFDDSSSDADAAREKMEKRQKKLQKNIKKVLTSEQYATWYQSERMKARKRPGGDPGRDRKREEGKNGLDNENFQ
jgi:hypothetical protein